MGHWSERSPEAALYRKHYSTKRWREIRADQLRKEPCCRMCAAHGRVTAATVCDHIEPHRGDMEKFWAGPFQSLCDDEMYRCHSSKKQSEERLGYSTEIGRDGYPIDPKHPFNQGK